jgi:RNA polymerase sigma factor (sigma-70 family)
VVASPELSTFCEEHWPKLVGALSLYTGDAHLAEELAQEAVAKLCRHWRRVRVMDAPDAWLHRVARNLAHSHFRRVSRGARATAGLQHDVVHADDEAVALRAAVSSLPERERDAIVARFYLGYSVRETAEMLDCPEGTVKTLTHRAIGRLRESGYVDEEIVDA